MMGRRPDPIQRFDDLCAEERTYNGSEMALSQATRAAERAIGDATRARVVAEAQALRGLADDREQAVQAEQAAHRAVADAKLARAAHTEAVQSLRRERNELVETAREDYFYPAAVTADENVKAAAAEVLESLSQLQAAAIEGAKAINRLRYRDLQTGGFVAGKPAELPFSLSTINAAVDRAAKTGMTWATDVNREESGAPISRQRLVDAAMRAG